MKKKRFILISLIITTSLYSYEAMCTLKVSEMDIFMKLVVKDKIMTEYNTNTNEKIGVKKYLGKTDKDYYIYGEDSKDLFVNIFLGPIKHGKFKYFRVSTYNNKVQWSGICKII